MSVNSGLELQEQICVICISSIIIHTAENISSQESNKLAVLWQNVRIFSKVQEWLIKICAY